MKMKMKMKSKEYIIWVNWDTNYAFKHLDSDLHMLLKVQATTEEDAIGKCKHYMEEEVVDDLTQIKDILVQNTRYIQDIT